MEKVTMTFNQFGMMSFATMPDRFPTDLVEMWALALGTFMGLAIIVCILTTARKLVNCKNRMTNIKGYLLIVLTMGQMCVATALFSRAYGGFHDETRLLLGISLWFGARVAISTVSVVRTYWFKRGKK